MPDIVITPNRGTSSNPKIDFTGTSAGTIKLEVLADGAIAWNGANGSLFGISDSLSGSLMSVNDISGLPAFEVFSDNRVIVGQFGARLGIGTVNPSSSSKLHIAGLNTAPPNIFLQTTNSAANGGIFWRNNNNATTSAISSNYNISDSSGNIEFLTNTTSTRMVITSGGNVGINVTQPGAKLEVGGEIYGWATVLSYSQNAGTISTFRNPNAGSSAYSSIYLGNDTAANKLVMFVNSSTRTADGGAGNTTIRTDTGNLILGAAGATRMTMDATTTYISGNTQFPFDNTDSDQWPVIRFGPNAASPNWDEGIIKGSSSRGVFAKQHMGIHFHEDRSFAFHTTGWDTEMEINGDGKIYMKGPILIGTSIGSGTNMKLHVRAGTGATYTTTVNKNTSMYGISVVGSDNANTMQGIWFASGSEAGTHWSGIAGSRQNYTADWGTKLSFFTHDEDTAAINNATEKMVITGNGNVGIGKTSPGYKLDVSGTTNTTRLNVAGYTMRSSATIDMSNTGTYSTSNFYPVTIPLSGYAGSHAMPIRMRILNSLNSNVPSWSTHGSGFTCHVEWTTNGSGWGTIAVQRAIHRYTEGYTNSTICGGISQLTNDSIEVIWLRGGGIYYFEADADVTPTPRSTNYTPPNGGGTANVVSVAVNNVIESALNTNPSFSRLNLTQSTGTAPFTVSSTTQVTNLNAQYLNGYSSDTANTANTIVRRDGSGNFSAGTITATLAGLATSETLSTVTGRGATTASQISVNSSAGGSMLTGTKAGGTYGDGVSGATFKSILDNANGGAAFAFSSYYGGSGGTLGASIRADGYSYFKETVGIGTTTPTTGGWLRKLSIAGTDASAVDMKIYNSDSAGQAAITLGVGSSGTGANNSTNFIMCGSTYPAYGALGPGMLGIYHYNNGLVLMADGGGGYIDFASGGSASKMRLTSGGNLGINQTNPTYKLDVTGDIRATGTAIVDIIQPNYNNGAIGPNSTSAPTNGHNDVSNSIKYLDGYGAPIPNGVEGSWWQGSVAIGNSTRGFQLTGGYSVQSLWYRRGADGWQSWVRCLNTSVDPYPSNMNQYVRTTDSPTFAALTVTNNVGLNVTSPSHRLHFAAGSFIGLPPSFSYVPSSWTRGSSGIIMAGSNNADGSGWSYGGRIVEVDEGDGLNIAFDVNYTNSWTNNVMVVSGRSGRLGNIGMGTTAPSYKLHVVGDIYSSTTVRDQYGDLRTLPENAKSAAYTLAASDTGRLITITTGGITVPANVFSVVGQVVTIYNKSGSNQTITQGSGVTLRQAGTANTGNRTLAQYGIATVICISATEFVISGSGLT